MEVAFTRAEAPGAWKDGTRVVKVKVLEGDAHDLGARATILGSIGPVALGGRPKVYGYFLEWDDAPGIPVFTSDEKIEPIS